MCNLVNRLKEKMAGNNGRFASFPCQPNDTLATTGMVEALNKEASSHQRIDNQNHVWTADVSLAAKSGDGGGRRGHGVQGDQCPKLSFRENTDTH